MTASGRAIQTYRKDPDAKLDYSLDWSTYLETGETISTSTWEVAAGITKVSDVKSGTLTTIWLSGGTEGERYQLRNLIVTSAGRQDQRSFDVLVESR